MMSSNTQNNAHIQPVFLFDLDGTLVDSVYQHVLAWKDALDTEGIELSVWRIHRQILA
jgi:beta-phosphoglucomutase-like phosphatase (HAD superfamily)